MVVFVLYTRSRLSHHEEEREREWERERVGERKREK